MFVRIRLVVHSLSLYSWELQALANGIKKIEDPLQIKKQKQEVRSSHTVCIRMPVMKIIPNF
jgi:hypothetical protein